jgi:hypothetical protein
LRPRFRHATHVGQAKSAPPEPQSG